jgi:RNA polymerase sigma factor (sigma-70 family)
MPPSQVPDVLVRDFENDVWIRDGPALQQLEPHWTVRLQQQCLRVQEVLQPQSDETLALAVVKSFFLKAAFTELFQVRYERRLLCWFRGWSVEANTALDLTQEIFLKLYQRKLAGYDPTRSFPGYLWTVAHNLRITDLRRRPGLTDDFDDQPATDCVEDEVERHELEARLEDTLSRLPPDQQPVMRLTLDDYSPAEIAEQLQSDVKAVYRRLHRARQTLARELGITLPPDNRGRKRKEDSTNPQDNLEA